MEKTRWLESGFRKGSPNSSRRFGQGSDLFEVTFDAVPGLPTGFDRVLHLILTTARDLEEGLAESWALAVEVADAIHRDDYKVLYEDSVGRKVLRLLRGTASPRKRAARG